MYAHSMIVTSHPLIETRTHIVRRAHSIFERKINWYGCELRWIYRMNHVIDTACRHGAALPSRVGGGGGGGVIPVHGRAVFVCPCLISCLVSFVYLWPHSPGPVAWVDRRAVYLSWPGGATPDKQSYCIQLLVRPDCATTIRSSVATLILLLARP